MSDPISRVIEYRGLKFVLTVEDNEETPDYVNVYLDIDPPARGIHTNAYTALRKVDDQ